MPEDLSSNFVLYNLKEDFAETNNLAEKEKDRLIAMIGMWYNEAGYGKTS